MLKRFNNPSFPFWITLYFSVDSSNCSMPRSAKSKIVHWHHYSYFLQLIVCLKPFLIVKYFFFSLSFFLSSFLPFFFAEWKISLGEHYSNTLTNLYYRCRSSKMYLWNCWVSGLLRWVCHSNSVSKWRLHANCFWSFVNMSCSCI